MKPDQVYRGLVINLAPLGDRPNVVWKVSRLKGRKSIELVRDIAPSETEARERAIAYIDSHLEQTQ